MLYSRLKTKYNSLYTLTHPHHIEKYNTINVDIIFNYHNILSWDSGYYMAHFQLKENVFFDISLNAVQSNFILVHMLKQFK